MQETLVCEFTLVLLKEYLCNNSLERTESKSGKLWYDL